MARRRLGFVRRLAVVLLLPMLRVWTKRDWSGTAHVPPEGPVIVAANHLSDFDPLVIAHFVYGAGRWPQFLAKSSLFKIFVIGPLLRSAWQIPVYRGTTDAVKSLEAAVAAVTAGGCLLIYPEGTTPKAGDLWPQRGKTGVARLYLQTGAPVVPVVSWGPQRIFDPRTRKFSFRPHTPVTVVAGPPLDLSKWAGAAQTPATLYAVTDEIMTALRDLLAKVRGEPAPEQPSASRTGIGNGAGNGGGGNGGGNDGDGAGGAGGGVG